MSWSSLTRRVCRPNRTTELVLEDRFESLTTGARVHVRGTAVLARVWLLASGWLLSHPAARCGCLTRPRLPSATNAVKAVQRSNGPALVKMISTPPNGCFTIQDDGATPPRLRPTSFSDAICGAASTTPFSDGSRAAGSRLMSGKVESVSTVCFAP